MFPATVNMDPCPGHARLPRVGRLEFPSWRVLAAGYPSQILELLLSEGNLTPERFKGGKAECFLFWAFCPILKRQVPRADSERLELAGHEARMSYNRPTLYPLIKKKTTDP